MGHFVTKFNSLGEFTATLPLDGKGPTGEPHLQISNVAELRYRAWSDEWFRSPVVATDFGVRREWCNTTGSTLVTERLEDRPLPEPKSNIGICGKRY